MKLFGWGANSYGQLGLGYKCEQILTPHEIKFEKETKDIKIKSITGGAGHSLILDEDGFIYSCGWNNKGQLGIKDEVLTFTKINPFCSHKITQIACGWDFSSAICDNNDIFVWGANNFSQIGLPKEVKHISQPTLIEGIKAKYVSCGLRHLAIVTTKGEIFVCGSGNKGQLGIIDGTGKPIRETKLQIIPGLHEMEYVSCGQNHTLALKSDGTIFCWGNNKHGQLGFNPEILEHVFTPKTLSFNTKPEKIFTGWTHSAILSQGAIYTFGRNTYYQLGSEREKFWEPGKLEINCVRLLCLGSEHNLAVNSSGRLFCWGWNEHGNCGTGDTEDVRNPTEILKGFKVLFASCGTGQSFAVVENDEMFDSNK